MSSLFSQPGKAALITGGGRGIGQAIAWAMAEQGSNIVLASRIKSELEETAEFIISTGRRVALIPIDLRETRCCCPSGGWLASGGGLWANPIRDCVGSVYDQVR